MSETSPTDMSRDHGMNADNQPEPPQVEKKPVLCEFADMCQPTQFSYSKVFPVQISKSWQENQRLWLIENPENRQTLLFI